MTPDEVKSARKALGLSQARLARVMHLRGPAAISEWENGVRQISDQNALLLRAYIDGYRPADWPQAEGENP